MSGDRLLRSSHQTKYQVRIASRVPIELASMTGPREAADWEWINTTNSVTRRDKSPGEPLQLCCGFPMAIDSLPTCDLITYPI
jgi:hypothetical protein